jgi:hypothetical protein
MTMSNRPKPRRQEKLKGLKLLTLPTRKLVTLSRASNLKAHLLVPLLKALQKDLNLCQRDGNILVMTMSNRPKSKRQERLKALTRLILPRALPLTVVQPVPLVEPL